MWDSRPKNEMSESHLKNLIENIYGKVFILLGRRFSRAETEYLLPTTMMENLGVVNGGLLIKIWATN